MRRSWLPALAIGAWLAVSPAQAAGERYAVRGLVVRVDVASRTVVVSHDRIPGLMEAMTMPFEVADPRELRGVEPGAVIEFTLVVEPRVALATGVRVRRHQPVEQDPLTARRLALLKRAMGTAVTPLAVGQRVPDVPLVDQAGRDVRLSAFMGQVVALNFVYTRCTLPQFCLRIANNFGVLQRRFSRALGRDLVLVTVTFDPERDTPAVLARYAAGLRADVRTWHFLTGAPPDVRRICGYFGVEAFADEGLMNHSLHTAVLDRQGRLVANIEGNQFTPEQLGDLIQETMDR